MIRRDGFPRRLLPLRRPQVLSTAPDRLFSAEEWARIHLGLQAPTMDDRWDAIVEGNRLFLHRSWTGDEIFEAQFAESPDGWRIAWALVESDPEHYRRRDDEYEATQLVRIIDGVVLFRRAAD